MVEVGIVLTMGGSVPVCVCVCVLVGTQFICRCDLAPASQRWCPPSFLPACRTSTFLPFHTFLLSSQAASTLPNLFSWYYLTITMLIIIVM